MKRALLSLLAAGTVFALPAARAADATDLNVTRVASGPEVGSDHYPLEITLHQRG